MDRWLDRQVILTLAYSAQFGFPLTADEVWLRLLRPHDKRENTVVSKQNVAESLVRLQQAGLVWHHQQYITVCGPSHSIFQSTTRSERAVVSRKKIAEAEQVAQRLANIPWIVGIGVTGSVAVSNAVEQDDIDFIIVTQPHTLWLARLLVTYIAYRAHKRRSWNREEEKSWCFNLWLETDALLVEPPRGKVYIAYEVCQVLWLYQKDQTAAKFYQQNNWVNKYVPNMYEKKSRQYTHGFTHNLPQRFGVLTGILNELAFWGQHWYMQSHMTRERVSKNYAFFHPRDTVSSVSSGWKRVLRNWKAYVSK